MDKFDAKDLLNRVDCGVMIADIETDSTIIYANDYLYEMFGYTKQEFTERCGNKAGAVISHEEKQRVKGIFSRQTGAGGDIKADIRGRRKDNTTIWINLSCHKIQLHTGLSAYFCTVTDVTREKIILNESYKSKGELDLITNSIPGGVIKLNMENGRFIYANDGFYRFTGYTRSEFADRFEESLVNLVFDDDKPGLINTIQKAASYGGPVVTEFRIRNKSGKALWGYMNGTRIEDEDGSIIYLCVIVNITGRKKTEELMKYNMQKTDKLAGMLKLTFWEYDIETKIMKRTGYIRNTYSSKREIDDPVGRKLMAKAVHPDDIHKINEIIRPETDARSGEKKVRRIRFKDEKGMYYSASVYSCYNVNTENNHPCITGATRIEDDMLSDIISSGTAAADYENGKMDFSKFSGNTSAEKDAVTGLLSYSSFVKRASEEMENPEENTRYAVICADINDFSKYNQHYGYTTGNEILKMYGDILIENLSRDGLCSRVDGDYFVMLFKYKTHNELIKAMTKVVTYQQSVDSTGNNLEYGSTIGLYLVKDNDPRELTDMLEKADLARRSIKGLKGNHYAIYRKEIENQLSREDEVIDDIRKAMREKQLEIHYIPRVKDGRENIIGCKAVPVIMKRDGNYVDTKELLRIMSNSQRLEDFGLYVLNEVAENIGGWKSGGNQVIPVSIEFSANQLGSVSVVKRINEIVERNNLRPEDFIFEISERYFMDSTVEFEVVIRKLGNLGYKIVVSRFGSDHTAINVLRELPVSGIKFHGEYFNDSMTSKRDKLILKHIVKMCDDIGVEVYCGGVNTELQERFAREIGCRIFEGQVFFSGVRPRIFEKYYMGKFKGKGTGA